MGAITGFDLTIRPGEAFRLIVKLFDRDTLAPVDVTGLTLVINQYLARGRVSLLQKIVLGAGTTTNFDFSGAETEALYHEILAEGEVRNELFFAMAEDAVSIAGGIATAEIRSARAIIPGAARPLDIEIDIPLGAAVVEMHVLGIPGIAQWQAMGFASAAAYDADQHDRAVASLLALLGPVPPTRGRAAGGEVTIQAPAGVPQNTPYWVRVIVNGAIQRPGVDFTSDGTVTLHLAFVLGAGDDWLVEQLERSPA